MPYYYFIAISLIVNIALCFFIQFRRYRFGLALPLYALAVVFPLYSLSGSALFINTDFAAADGLPLRLFLAFSMVSTFLLHEVVRHFLKRGDFNVSSVLKKSSFPASAAIRILGTIALIAIAAVPMTDLVDFGGIAVLKLNTVATVFVIVQIGLVLYTLFLLENTYRFAAAYQRKIARLCFIALAIILVFQVYSASHLLLYKFIFRRNFDLATVVYGVSYPVLLLGLVRYRLGSERVNVPRNAVYSTVSLFLCGAAFLGIGCTAMVFKWLNLDFSYFQKTLAVFSLCLFALLLIGSGDMRKRISFFINNYFYSYKYDYREQFYNLHRSYMTGENVDDTLTEIIENMKYSVAADDAYIFLVNDADGHLYMHQNKESATVSHCVIRSDSLLVNELNRTQAPLASEALKNKAADTGVAGGNETGHLPIKADIFFPITNRNQLLGVLALRLRPKAKIDAEDRALIEVFANAIGDVLFKNKVLTERVERKQFESFSHLSSFIIHDIKNQTSTLSLLVQNAAKNINNPQFQKSLGLSLGSCVDNLQTLVEKLKSPPKLDGMKMERLDLNAVIDRAVLNTGAGALEQVRFKFNKGECPEIPGDRDSLFYAVKNLVVNALEAMNNKGDLTLATGPLAPAPPELRRLINSGDDFFKAFKVFIMVSDTGRGMTREFMENKLFHPFETTKDKGIGIGLYQCKTLIEKMGGKILCRSEVGRGTDFCILL
ncbi:MAG: ATP-binding protein [Chitinivibrionales bacterium]|nr:ATP-binding protein [Chitinivibrionales bacterium]